MDTPFQLMPRNYPSGPSPQRMSEDVQFNPPKNSDTEPRAKVPEQRDLLLSPHSAKIHYGNNTPDSTSLDAIYAQTIEPTSPGARIQNGLVGQFATMKDRDSTRHPGPWRVMRVDSESAGIIIAIAFVVLGVVGLPIGKWFLLGALGLGAVVAIGFRMARKS